MTVADVVVEGGGGAEVSGDSGDALVTAQWPLLSRMLRTGEQARHACQQEADV